MDPPGFVGGRWYCRHRSNGYYVKLCHCSRFSLTQGHRIALEKLAVLIGVVLIFLIGSWFFSLLHGHYLKNLMLQVVVYELGPGCLRDPITGSNPLTLFDRECCHPVTH